MEIKKSFEIYDDKGININGKLCLFKISKTTRKHKYDGMYGVSGAEFTQDCYYDEKNEFKILGIFDQDKGIINKFNCGYYDLNKESYKVLKVKVVDIEELLKTI